MPDMTDVIAAHYTPTWHLGGTVKCECGESLGEWRKVDENLARSAHAAHVAAALETAGYGLVVGEKEWGVRYSDSQHVSRHIGHGSARFSADAHNAINKSEWHQPFTMEVVSRTVTAWKKEA